MIYYLNDNSIIFLNKYKDNITNDLVFNSRNKLVNAKLINSDLDLEILNKIFINYCIKNFLNKRKSMFGLAFKQTIINIYKHKDDIQTKFETNSLLNKEI